MLLPASSLQIRLLRAHLEMAIGDNALSATDGQVVMENSNTQFLASLLLASCMHPQWHFRRTLSAHYDPEGVGYRRHLCSTTKHTLHVHILSLLVQEVVI